MPAEIDILQRKIQQRQIALRDSTQPASAGGAASLGELQQRLDAINAALCEANAYAHLVPGEIPPSSHRWIGRFIVFGKRALRKLLRVTLGWYIFPLVHRQNQFNSAMLRLATLEKDALAALADSQDTVNALRQISERLQSSVSELQAQAQTHDKHIADIINLPTNDDQFYHDFEEVFRGSFETICDRVSGYVPLIREHVPDFSAARFIDLGSGRGEWLEVIRANGATDYVGVDLNDVQNDFARTRGHQAITQDGVAYLASLENESIDVITAFQLIEHLPMSSLMQLLEQSFRVLRKGGVILFETPNPQTLMVGANSFYLDPSHKRSLDPRLTTFMAEYCGFSQVRAIQANSDPGSSPVAENADFEALVKRVNDISWTIWGPQDYALFGVKE